MLYAALMLLGLASLWAGWKQAPVQVVLFVLAAAATAWAFVADVTTKLTISL